LEDWDVERVKGYVSSVFPNYLSRAGDKAHEVEACFDDLAKAMGGKRKVTFSVVLVLATKK
jgi:hypothetical protein